VSRALRLAVTGIAFGTVASFAVAKSIETLLFGTRPTDPATFTGIVLVIGFVALVAGYVPAWRASHIDPMIALRNN
jgi:ABC-type antimicrobial peptide transport system permease subunit